MLFLIAVLCVLANALYAQVDSIETQILNYQNSKADIIAKGRKLLLDKLLENDFQKVKEIKDYLKEKVENKEYLSLYPAEYWLILYWTKEYDQLTRDIVAFKTDSTFASKIRPYPDKLSEELEEKSFKSAAILRGQIMSSQLDSSTKEFLQLNLEYLMLFGPDNPENQEHFNLLADNYLQTYPESKYEEYTRTYIRYKLVPKKWAGAFEFFSGYGMFTGELHKSYTNNVPIGVAFDIYYKRYVLFLRDYIGFGQTKKDFPYSTGVWEEGSGTIVFVPEASLGYVAIDPT